MKIDAKLKKRLMTAGSVFAIALGTGFVMQNISPMADRFIGGDGEETVVGTAGPANEIQPLSSAPHQRMSPAAASGPAPVAQARPEAPQAPAPEKAVAALRTAALLPMPQAQPKAAPATAPVQMAAFSPEPEGQSDAAPMRTPAEPKAADSCTFKLNARAQEAAMVRLTVTAPCHPGAAVTLKHGPLSFTEITDDTGALSVDVPALTAKAAFEARLDTGERALAMTLVDETEAYQRTALTWQGRAGVGLHAFENGAGYNTEGHIDAAAPAAPARALAGEGGYITLLGAADMPGALMAEVYSYPTAAGGTVRINVEAEVTAANCGRELSAKVLTKGAQGFAPQALSATMPECDAVGEFLVFSGILPEIRLASAE